MVATPFGALMLAVLIAAVGGIAWWLRRRT
jgi:hypothetical protein